MLLIKHLNKISNSKKIRSCWTRFSIFCHQIKI